MPAPFVTALTYFNIARAFNDGLLRRYLNLLCSASIDFKAIFNNTIFLLVINNYLQVKLNYLLQLLKACW